MKQILPQCTMRTVHEIREGDIIDCCRMISVNLNKVKKSINYVVDVRKGDGLSLEILLTDWKGKTDDMKKSIKIHCHIGVRYRDFFIGNFYESLKCFGIGVNLTMENSSSIVKAWNNSINCYLKANSAIIICFENENNAPDWSRNEITAVMKCFFKCGFKYFFNDKYVIKKAVQFAGMKRESDHLEGK